MKITEHMPCKYNTEKDLYDRLNGTLCRYKGKIVVVLVEGLQVSIRDPLNNKFLKYILPNDPDFDLSSPEMGYMNLILPEGKNPKLRVFYAERTPRRQYRQGLCANNIGFGTLDGSAIREVMAQVPGFPESSWIGYPGFIQMLEDDYPTLDEAFYILDVGYTTAKMSDPKTLEFVDTKVEVTVMAISKDTAIQKTDSGVYQVWYKCDNVGWMAPGTRTVNVKSSDIGWIVSKYLSLFSWKVE